MVRASAVRELGSDQAELIASIARGDEDNRVRRAATRRLGNPELLAEIASHDDDDSVRKEALAVLASLAVETRDEPAGALAVAALTEPKHLTAVARGARLEALRKAALERLSDPRSLVSVAKGGLDPVTRLAALGAVSEASALLEIAVKCEHKETALAALERVKDEAALEKVAERGRSKAAAKRARVRLTQREQPAQSAPTRPTPEQLAEEQALYEAKLAEQEQLARAREEGVRSRVTLCETVESLRGDETLSRLEEAKTAWQGLEPVEDPRSQELERRFVSAGEECVGRHDSWSTLQARLPRLESLCEELEALADAEPDPGVSRTANELRRAWEALADGEPVEAALGERFQAASARVEERASKGRAEQAERASRNRGRLEELCRRSRQLVEQQDPNLRDAERCLRELRSALLDPGPLPRKHDLAALQGSLKAARSALFPRVQELREADDWSRWSNVSIQEELCGRTEALIEAEDLEKAARELRQIDEEWKQARKVPKDQAEALWKRFRQAREKVRERCDRHFAEKAEQQAENLAAKEALCEQAEALADSSDWVKTAEALKGLQEQWKKTGPVARRQSAAVWRRFRKACDGFFERRKADLTSRKAEWAKNLEAKEALCQQAEALVESSEWDATARELKRLQAEWKKIGPVRRSRSDAVWKRFRAACDAFFERFKNRDQLERAALLADREALCSELEALRDAEAAPDDLADQVAKILARWRGSPLPRGDEAKALERRFGEVRDQLVEAHAERFAGTELDPSANAARLEKICSRVEALELPEVVDSDVTDVATLSQRLKDALATNTLGGKDAQEARWRELRQEVDSARSAWRRVGPVPGEAGRALQSRFDEGCRRVSERKR